MAPRRSLSMETTAMPSPRDPPRGGVCQQVFDLHAQKRDESVLGDQEQDLFDAASKATNRHRGVLGITRDD